MATVVAFHAHPDDEVLMTGGTLARIAAEGHRVVIAVATDGEVGAATHGEPVRMRELRASASTLGAARVVHLGYADSGSGRELYPDPPDRVRFVRADTQEAAEQLASLLREEQADVLLSYDVNGGYGHRDHLKVHEVGRHAARLAEVDHVLEATIPRDLVARVVKLVDHLRIPVRHDAVSVRSSYSPRATITHRVNARSFARQKQAALARHQTQLRGSGRLAPVMRVLARLPVPVFGLLLGREWFVDATGSSTPEVLSSIFQPLTTPFRR
ncbi:PIG-L deacetylase family protein [Streptomyces sp. C36]|uniref:PIG-L deacetylase family protein n=1 Tax=Streptomyces sp. C36 TaxID=3237122 RepID=UPI0034C691FF